MKINWDVPQGSYEWLIERLKRTATTSELKNVFTSKGEVSRSIEKYLEKKARESQMLLPVMPSYVSGLMLHGIRNEDRARKWLSKQIGKEIRQVGFVTTDDGHFGSSPDGIISGEDWGIEGVVELKCPDLKAHIDYFSGGKLPAAHKIQVHGEMAVCGAKYAWFASCFYTDEPEPRELVNQFKIKIERDDFTDLLAERLQEVHEMLLATKKRLGIAA